MKKFSLLLVSTLLLAGVPHLRAAESPELTRAREELLQAYRRGDTDESNSVKQAKAEIARLEYLAAHGGASNDTPTGITVDFPGGPVSALIAAINKAGANFNVVGDRDVLELKLPPLAVRNADVYSFAAALGGILPDGYVLLPNGRINGNAVSVVYTLRRQTPLEASQANYQLSHASSGLVFQSFQLAPYLGTQSVEDIVGAIRAAWELDPAHKPDALHLKFHPPTGILLVSAPPDGTMITQSVLQQLRKTADAKPPSQPTTKE